FSSRHRALDAGADDGIPSPDLGSCALHNEQAVTLFIGHTLPKARPSVTPWNTKKSHPRDFSFAERMSCPRMHSAHIQPRENRVNPRVAVIATLSGNGYRR